MIFRILFILLIVTYFIGATMLALHRVKILSINDDYIKIYKRYLRVFGLTILFGIVMLTMTLLLIKVVDPNDYLYQKSQDSSTFWILIPIVLTIPSFYTGIKENKLYRQMSENRLDLDWSAKASDYTTGFMLGPAWGMLRIIILCIMTEGLTRSFYIDI